jgi:hypothetical protein
MLKKHYIRHPTMTEERTSLFAVPSVNSSQKPFLCIAAIVCLCLQRLDLLGLTMKNKYRNEYVLEVPIGVANSMKCVSERIYCLSFSFRDKQN